MIKWTHFTLKNSEQAGKMVELFLKLQSKVGAFDTETTGLHLILDKPFLFQFGFIDNEEKNGYTFVVDIEQQPHFALKVIKAWNKLAEELDIYLGHNVKYDLHMLKNIGIDYTAGNISDTMLYIRLAHDAIQEAHGGPPLRLKAYASKYVTRSAAAHEMLLKAERTQIAKEINAKLRKRLANCPPPSGFNSWTLKAIEDFFKDKLRDFTDLPSKEAQEAYKEWLFYDVPLYLQTKITGIVESDQIQYNKLNRQNVIKYAHLDIVWTLETYLHTYKALKARDNLTALKYENDIIYPLFEMERTGFKADKEYLETSRLRLKEYILKRRQHLWDIAGQKINIQQKQVILQILQEDYKLSIQSTDKKILAKTKADLQHTDPENPAIDFITTLQELRTLEKWYSTYILRFQKSLIHTDRLYTQINQAGAVSGRFTSDFQQFPKGIIKTIDGQELFCPRRIVIVTGGKYKTLAYLDYSQIELRLQALYTILVGNPDLNLCRAYMPFKCYNEQEELFEPTNKAHLQSWNKNWYLEEDRSKLWTPTDVHGETTKIAFNITEEHPDFEKLRKYGKQINFAKNYGASILVIMGLFPNKSDEEIQIIDGAYYKAFPGVKTYHQYCYNAATSFSNVQNLFGVRYYNVSGHNLINMLIQGSGAYLLKIKIKELYDYAKAHNLKTKMQMNIHDEISWEIYEGEEEHIQKFKEIMETWDDTLVPIVAELEVTTTSWADKKKVA